MLFNSREFLCFFPIVLLVAFIIPKKVRYLWLLAASYYFYMGWNPVYILLLLSSTVITYISGLLLERAKHSDQPEAVIVRKKKRIVALSFILNLGVLFWFKYLMFAERILGALFRVLGMQLQLREFDILLPVGISFFTFQALSYTMDVYRDEIYAEKNFFRYALYVSFFPQLVAGPIERSKNLLRQLAKPVSFSFENAREGFMMMLWGYFLKMVLADRIAIFVDTVYGDYASYPGWYLIIATLLFAVQIYCDFGGYSTIAMGAARFLGIRLMENFNAPYLSAGIADFWRKWHISLTSWFRDYVYIPLGGNRKGKVRKRINVMIVFLLSGLWHGANITYVIWGAMNGLFQVISDIVKPVRKKILGSIGINLRSFGYKLFCALFTFFLVNLSWVFFRADHVSDALQIIRSSVSAKNYWIFFDNSLYTCGLNRRNFGLMLFCIGILFIADLAKHYGFSVRKFILKQDYLFRVIAIVVSICFILVFGLWGPGYNAANFIYFQF